MYRNIYFCIICLAILVTAGCNTPDPPSFQEDISEDVHADSPSVPINTSPYEFVEIFRIGDESRGDSILLSAHGSAIISVNSKNQIFVGGGWPVSPIMFFSDEGHFIGFIGAVGEGPGEYEAVGSIVIGPEDSVYVYDWDLDRLSVFESDTRNYASSISLLNDQSPTGPSRLLGVTERGFLFRYIMPFCPPGDPVCGYDPDETRLDSVNLVDKRGNIVGLIADRPAGERFVRASGGSISVMGLPFGKDPFFAYKNGLLYTGWNDMIEISIISEDGEVMRTINREHEITPVTRRELLSEIAGYSEETRREILGYDMLPETKPAYDQLVVDDNGHVWIREYPGMDSKFANWLIFDSDSKLIGEMELPTNLLLKTIKGDRAYASISSEIYGPYIVVYRIAEQSSPA